MSPDICCVCVSLIAVKNICEESSLPLSFLFLSFSRRGGKVRKLFGHSLLLLTRSALSSQSELKCSGARFPIPRNLRCLEELDEACAAICGDVQERREMPEVCHTFLLTNHYFYEVGFRNQKRQLLHVFLCGNRKHDVLRDKLSE